MISSKVTDLIGNTPVLRIAVPHKKSALFLKMEKNNPGGSMKDRMARNMVIAGLKSGKIKPKSTIIESSSGNTGIGLALAAIEFDLHFIAVVDHHAAPDKISIMKALGADIRYVTGDYQEDEVAVVERQRLASELASQLPNATFLNQSDNAANSGGYAALVCELIEQIGKIDAYVGCVGTGGSITGISQGLKAHNPQTITVAVEPEGSIIFGNPGKPYYQSGTGTPKGDTVGLVLDYSCIDHNAQVSDCQAFETTRFLANKYGLLVGGSTGGIVYKALEYINTDILSGNVVVIVVDGGEKYLNTIFNEQWLSARNLISEEISHQLNRWLTNTIPLEQAN
ncbi:MULTISPECIES: PLP-dependent cysteine synthase family protein [Providencia]|uniref:cysteine synthase n=2 Tax=Providencia stuartii TaxID=588 RepID=A0AA86YWA7_PROST|nr:MULTISPECIES: cysteine synthase family protein [Providencia]SST04874.1 aspartyl/glutamyl-tRNA amidotransferase subunit A [Acinetobacter baumannii]AFH93929.1 Pyridoxal-5'-phosphate-dependent protein subunit beta [Providencia stuartii MRSN 2154]AIN63574.1 pyridoxal-phosphate dependent enzyme family protein [Providencia stuartii]AMG67720.1 cysteine synthase family protein [Providencia stuartii]APG51881.1 cysteine synthase [Providencia stuartii]